MATIFLAPLLFLYTPIGRLPFAIADEYDTT